MDISTELESIEGRHWNNSALKASAISIIFAYKALIEYAASTNRKIEEISPSELIENIVDADTRPF